MNPYEQLSMEEAAYKIAEYTWYNDDNLPDGVEDVVVCKNGILIMTGGGTVIEGSYYYPKMMIPFEDVEKEIQKEREEVALGYERELAELKQNYESELKILNKVETVYKEYKKTP
jgi:hypothetical protein